MSHEINRYAPFNRELVPASYRTAGGSQREKLFFLKGTRKVIKTSYYAGPKITEYGPGPLYNLLAELKYIVEQLRDRYNIPIPNFDIVGAPRNVFIVIDRINGSNLVSARYKMDEMPQVIPMLDNLYSNIAYYLSDVYQLGGYYIGDLAVIGSIARRGTEDHDPTANSQFVYGNRAKDRDKKIYFVDIEPKLGGLNSKEPVQRQEFIAQNFGGLRLMIKESERKLKMPLSQSRNTIKDFLVNLPGGDLESEVVLPLYTKLGSEWGW